MPYPADHPTFLLLAPPYDRLLALDDREEFPSDPRVFRGAALIWCVGGDVPLEHTERAQTRPPGLPLILALPPAAELPRFRPRVLEILEETRPHAVLPYHPRLDVEELVIILRAEIGCLADEIEEYLLWRGLKIDQETKRILRRAAELAGELTTVSALARAVYVSRRALGRRFLDRGLPTPSRWLQIFRQLRAVIALQNTENSLFHIATALGYPDGFTLSNQMERLVGVRPSVARERLGWEWYFETWLQKEEEQGRFPSRPPSSCILKT
jgi:AraC-like DNA-binding protein